MNKTTIKPEYLQGLICEYDAYVETSKTVYSAVNKDILKKEIKLNGGWSTEASEILFELAKNYGSFILGNALALAEAMEIVDGDLGL
ncbi:MAG: hypothetical protein KAT56_02820 [Sedimentisphaerales bacterium]|nr:hypothetical protein [Sedimentisphaerales bacterium]